MATKVKAKQETLAGRQPLEHGFTLYRILCLILAILLVLGVKYGMIVVPEIRETANQVANLNEIKKVDVRCHLACGSFNCLGSL